MTTLTKLISFLFLLNISSLSSEENWVSLLDQDLSQWEVFIGPPHPSVELPEGVEVKKDKNNKAMPLGLNNDPLNVFSAATEDGETILKITGQIYGGLTSKESYENYHFKCEFRWGEKKWAPRLNIKRDSGILFHCNGRHGAFWNVWMQSLECQVQEGDCGDFITLSGTSAKVPIIQKEGSKKKYFDFNADLKRFSGYLKHAPSHENPNGEWNTIEILTIGQTSIFKVNGTPNMVLFDAMRRNEEKKQEPLTSGKIQIQSEGAEVDYKNIMIKPIKTFPKELALYLRNEVL